MDSFQGRRLAVYRLAYAVARVMLAAIFLVTGASKLINLPEAAADIVAAGLPFAEPLAVIAGALELVCGTLLLLGIATRWAALGLIVFLVPVTLILQSPLPPPAGSGSGELIDFLKNLAIIGGLLTVVVIERRTLR